MNIHVGNLQKNVTDYELRDLFEEFGEVSDVNIIIDRETGESKGFALVEMDDYDGNSAIESLNGRDFQGRPLILRRAPPRSVEHRRRW